MTEESFLRSVHENQGIIIKITRIYTFSEEDYEDLYQEILSQLWKSRNSFKGESKWSTWMYQVALFTALTFVKKWKKKEVDPELFPDSAEEYPQSEIDHLYLCIKQLKKAERAVILLYLENKSYEEIAEILGITVNLVGVKLNRIRKKLKDIWNSSN